MKEDSSPFERSLGDGQTACANIDAAPLGSPDVRSFLPRTISSAMPLRRAEENASRMFMRRCETPSTFGEATGYDEL